MCVAGTQPPAHLRNINVRVSNAAAASKRVWPRSSAGGRVSVRQEILHEVCKDESKHIFIFTLQVGGEGWNLLNTNVLILCEPHWNPEKESQAVDRIYRLYHKKPQITVHRLLNGHPQENEKTIEQAIMRKKSTKKDINQAVITGTKSTGLCCQMD